MKWFITLINERPILAANSTGWCSLIFSFCNEITPLLQTMSLLVSIVAGGIGIYLGIRKIISERKKNK
jgi:hypothetical protein